MKMIFGGHCKKMSQGSTLPALSSGEVSTDFYSAAISGGLVVDTTLIEQIKPTTYTEKVLYAAGDNPRYDGTASAHVSTLNGRYDYTYDCHNRLIKADYTKVLQLKERGFKPVSMEDFSTSYSYNAVGAPLTLKRQGVIAPAAEDGSTEPEYRLMDDLSYQWDGMLLASVTAQACTFGFGVPGYY